MADPQSDQDYDSADDEDFAPAENGEAGSDAESSDEEAGTRALKRKQPEELDWDNSGDEKVVTKARKKRATTEDEEVTGDGGMIKTRSQRQARDEETKKPSIGKSSLDVNNLWAQMTGTSAAVTNKSLQETSAAPARDAEPYLGQPSESTTADPSLGKIVTIKRTYEFAGEKRTEKRTVAADSAEARLYLGAQTESNSAATKPGVRRPKKRTLLGANTTNSTGPKLNTLEKSKLDWAGYVDESGLSEELEGHDRAKGEYLGRMDFLNRLETRKEDHIRNAKQG